MGCRPTGRSRAARLEHATVTSPEPDPGRDSESEGTLPLGGLTESALPSRDLPIPTSALAIVAHPDDAEFLCGGTLAKWAVAGCTIHHLILTDGSKGSWDAGADTAELIETRRNEQLRAARVLGSKGKVIMLGRVDGELTASSDVVDEVAYWIRVTEPTVVLAHDPWKRYRLHPDHRNAGWIALDSVVAARDPHFFPEHDVPHHRPSALLLFEADQPDHVEDITEYTDAKVDALLTHRSQFHTTHGIGDPDDVEQRERFRERVTEHAARLGAANGVGGAEIFKLITDL
ncbi:MAG: PIG-L family deacetylase [Actinobacteria bacterium]|nr:PIG-L family deacetylase [Actinomycetota bacterium]